MSILKFEHRTPRSLEEMYAYLCAPNKTDAYGIFGIGVNPFDTVNEMRFVQNHYHHENMKHEYVQRIFCFDVGIRVDIGLLREVCARIGQVLITDKRQVFGAIHYLNQDAHHIHCHYMINYVGIDGSLYQQKFHVNHYKSLVNEILAEYGCFQPIKFYEPERRLTNMQEKAFPFRIEVPCPWDVVIPCPWTVDESRIRPPSQETIDTVAQTMPETPNPQMTSPSSHPSTHTTTDMAESQYTNSPCGQEPMEGEQAHSPNYMPSQDLPTPNIYVSPLRAKPQDFTYNESLGILYWLQRNKNLTERRRLANFEVEVEKGYTLVATNAQEERIILSIRNNLHHVSLDIALAKLTSLIQELTAQYPQFRLFCDLGRAGSIFQQYVSEVYELSLPTLTHEIIYQNAGWQLSPHGWHYYSGNDANCRSDFCLAVVEYEPSDLVAWVGDLFAITDYQIMLPLLLHAHLGYTLKLFEDAGYNEQFVLTMIGASGSKKTSLARVLFSLFGDALINFTSTDRAIELQMMSRQDSTMILDDLPYGSDKVLAGKFEKLLRQLGDSTGRKRSINNGNVQDSVNTRCAVVLTAETDIDALSKSSKLRTLAVFLNHDSVNSEILRRFQEDEWSAKSSGRFSRLEQYMSLYIQFIEAHYQACVEALIDARQRSEHQFHFARQATIFKMLVGQAELILLVWEACGMITGKENLDLYERWMKVLVNVMKINEHRGKEAEPYLLFLQAIAQAVHSGGISQSKDFYNESRLGFLDSEQHYEKLYLYPAAAYDYVIDYYRRSGKIFTESPKALWNKLYNLDLIEVYKQGNHKAKLFKKVKLSRQFVDCLVLKWNVVKAFLETLTPEITLSH